jgi:hypothetical protein
MTATLTTATPIAPARGTIFTPTILCAGMLTLITAAFIAGFLVTGTEATTLAIGRDGADLTRLMRFLAAIKGVMALGAPAAGRWGGGVGVDLPPAISLPLFAAYAVTCAAMAAGPGLIWSMSHVALGALLFHGGLFATVLLLWNDPAVGARLADMVAARRRTIATRTG